jgi:cytochrome P450
LCWSSANLDETAFPHATEVRLDRKPNPHLSFGFGVHLCLGAPHARLLLRTLLQQCTERIDHIAIVEAKDRVENEPAYRRHVGYESITVRLVPLRES